jgi:putative oxidoreductase
MLLRIAKDFKPPRISIDFSPLPVRLVNDLLSDLCGFAKPSSAGDEARPPSAPDRPGRPHPARLPDPEHHDPSPPGGRFVPPGPGEREEGRTMLRRSSDFAPLPVRLVYGLLYALSGWPKFSGIGHANIVYLLGQLGFPWPEVTSYLVAAVEFGGGLALILGAFTRLVAGLNVLSTSSLLLLAWLRGGIPEPRNPALRHFPYEFPSYTVSLFIIAGLLFLLLGGAGAWSIDSWRSRRQAA